MKKQMCFDQVTVGAEFFMKFDPDEDGNLRKTEEDVTYAKLSAMTAVARGGQVRFTSLVKPRASTSVEIFVPDPTPEELAAEEAESLQWRIKAFAFKQFLCSVIEESDKVMAVFKLRLDENPVNAFEWADKTVKAAARVWVARRLLVIYTEKGYDAALRVATKEALSGACNPSHSTSTMSNFTVECQTEAWAEIASRGLVP